MTSIARARSLYCPPSGIRLSSCLSSLRSKAKEREVTVLVSVSELVLESALASEEEVEVEDCLIFFIPCRWINNPFTHIRVLVEGMLAVAVATSETEDEFTHGGAVVGGEVSSVRIRRHCHISLVGGDAVICFCLPELRVRRTLPVAEVEAKREVGANCEEV